MGLFNGKGIPGFRTPRKSDNADKKPIGRD